MTAPAQNILNILSRWLTRPPLWFVVLAALLFSAAIQFQEPNIVGVDGYYHIRASQQVLDSGFPDTFPAVRFGLWAKGYSDKDAGFHLLLALFTLLGPILGAKVLVTLINTAIIVLAFLILRGLGTPFALLFAFALPTFSAHLLFRLQMPRAHILAVTLFIAFVWALLRERRLWVFLLCAAFTLSYTAFHFFIALSLITCLVLSLRRRKLLPALFIISLAGVALGLLLHPHFPDKLSFWYVQNIKVVLAGWSKVAGIKPGPEMFPGTTSQWLHGAPVYLLSCWIAVAYVAVKRIRVDDQLAMLFIIATLTGLMSMKSMRFVEYAIPAGALLLGKVAALAWEEVQAQRSRHKFLALAGVLCAASVAHALYRASNQFERTPIYSDRFIASYTASVQPGDTVFTCDWESVPQLYYARVDARYIAMLDPMFLLAADPGRYQLWQAMIKGLLPDPAPLITDIFKARWAVCPAKHVLSRQLLRRTGIKPVFSDGAQMFFQVGTLADPPATRWEVAGPIPSKRFFKGLLQRPPQFKPTPMPHFARGSALAAAFLIWPPRLRSPACFLARTTFRSPGGKGVLKIGAPGRLLQVIVGGRQLRPPLVAAPYAADAHQWEVDLPKGSLPVQLTLCIDPAETPPPYGLSGIGWTPLQ